MFDIFHLQFCNDDFKKLFIDFRERGRGRVREININLLLHLLMYSLVASCMCPERGSNSSPWCIGMAL